MIRAEFTLSALVPMVYDIASSSIKLWQEFYYHLGVSLLLVLLVLLSINVKGRCRSFPCISLITLVYLQSNFSNSF